MPHAFFKYVDHECMGKKRYPWSNIYIESLNKTNADRLFVKLFGFDPVEAPTPEGHEHYCDNGVQSIYHPESRGNMMFNTRKLTRNTFVCHGKFALPEHSSCFCCIVLTKQRQTAIFSKEEAITDEILYYTLATLGDPPPPKEKFSYTL